MRFVVQIDPLHVGLFHIHQGRINVTLVQCDQPIGNRLLPAGGIQAGNVVDVGHADQRRFDFRAAGLELGDRQSADDRLFGEKIDLLFVNFLWFCHFSITECNAL